MNETSVPSGASGADPAPILASLADALPRMGPQLRLAARWVLDNPNEIGVASTREVAAAAGVKPNTLVRMARAAGFEGWEDFRQPFREALRAGRQTFPDRARWLQSLGRGGRHAPLFADMAGAMLGNIEQLYTGTGAAELKAAADRIVRARTTWVVGVGVAWALAHNFAYLTRMALDSVVAVPRDGSLPVDDLARAGRRDVVLAMTFDPYRAEVLDAVECARGQGARVIAISDSRACPILAGAAHAFVVPTETPQFFTSTVAAAALLETLAAFVVADAPPAVIRRIEAFHRRRFELGVYRVE